MTTFIATLPMYDWPEIQSHNDKFWKTIRNALLDQGFSPPDNLTRSKDVVSCWKDGRLLLGQTCGLPFVTGLKDQVSLIGTPAYEIECGAGSYFSVIVVRKDCEAASISDLASARIGYNDAMSQSGFAALYTHLVSHNISPGALVSAVQTGSHRQSIKAIAEGKIDFAAIDAVSWELALRHEPAAKGLKVLEKTKQVPGLPLITSLRSRKEVERIQTAVINAMIALDEATRESLLLMGFSATTMADYEVIRQGYERIEENLKMFT
jgi:ABC-type phosphate/phosphonate transport system substrate-binding protein